MTSKEAKTHIIDTLNGDMNKEYFINELLPEILKDLERLEEFEKVLNGHCSKCVNRENNICVGMDAPIHIDTLINCIEMLSTELQTENQDLKNENKVLKACIKDWEDDYEHLEFALEKREKVLEILKKYLYYDNKNHAIKMKEVRKSIYNFDYEDLKEMLRK